MNLAINMQTMINAVRRATLSMHVYYLDQRYHELGNHLEVLEESRKDAVKTRQAILIERVKTNAALNKLGGI